MGKMYTEKISSMSFKYSILQKEIVYFVDSRELSLEAYSNQDDFKKWSKVLLWNIFSFFAVVSCLYDV